VNIGVRNIPGEEKEALLMVGEEHTHHNISA